MYFSVRTLAFITGIILLISLPQTSLLYGEERTHVVERNDTFFSIARTYGINADELMRFNGFTDPSRLPVGHRLRIPSTVNTQSSSLDEFITYSVVRGDTFFSLGRRFSVTEALIREINNLSNSYVLREGDTLRIPSLNASHAAPVISPPSVNWPVNAREINYLTGRLSGVMITGERFEPVRSLTHGTVISVGPYRGFGRVAIIQVDGGYLYVYGGCETLTVREGDRVYPGSEIGRLGIDLVTNLPQLFFMVYRSNTPIDPALAPRA